METGSIVPNFSHQHSCLGGTLYGIQLWNNFAVYAAFPKLQIREFDQIIWCIINGKHIDFRFASSVWKFNTVVSRMSHSVWSGYNKMPMRSLTRHCTFQQNVSVRICWSISLYNISFFGMFLQHYFLVSFTNIVQHRSHHIIFESCEAQITEWLTSDHHMRVRLKPWIGERVWDQRQINVYSVYAKFVRGHKNICLHFVPFLHIDMTQVVEIRP